MELTKKQKEVLKELSEDWIKLEILKLWGMRKQCMEEMEKLADNKERKMFLESIKIRDSLR